MYKTHNTYNCNGNKIIFKYFSIEWLLPPLDLEPRPANHISTVLTTRPSYNAKRHATMAYIPHAINRSHVDDAIDIISIISIIDMKRIIASIWKIMCIIYISDIICLIVLYE